MASRDGYPLYRRRSPEQGGQTVFKDGMMYDNSWVIPYNPFLLRYFDCHLNVEVRTYARASYTSCYQIVHLYDFAQPRCYATTCRCAWA